MSFPVGYFDIATNRNVLTCKHLVIDCTTVRANVDPHFCRQMGEVLFTRFHTSECT